MDNTTTPPTPSLDAIIYSPVGDTETKRAFIMLLPGGGGKLGSMEWVATRLCNLGYVCGEFDCGGGDEFSQIAHAGCFNRFMHKNHSAYGIVGGKFLAIGISIGGAILWGENICLDVIRTDRQFISPVNDLYPNANMKMLGSASMPGGVDSMIFKYIDSSCHAHFDSHGNRDTLLPLEKSQAAVDQMNHFGVGSRLDIYPGSGHDLSGLHDIIISKIITFFAELMEIKPIVVTTPPISES